MSLNNIRLVEIELHSYCNRQCKFCPNSFIDRHSENIFMEDNIFKKIIDELAEINYCGHISFSRYNEPFACPVNLRKKVDYIKNKLPKVKLVSNTNGDYDNVAFRDDIEITEMDYDGNKKCYISEDKRYRVMRLGSINNRGGILKLKKIPRTIPCLEPTHFIGVNFDGTISPCCSIRNDVSIHKPYILGDLHNNTLVEILNSKKAIKFRQDVKSMKFPNICKYCQNKGGRYTTKRGIEG